MAAILPYQRQATDAPGLGPTPQMSGEDPIARGLNSVAGGLSNLSDGMYARDQKTKAMQSSVALATLNNDLRDAHDEIARAVQAGEVPTDKAIPMFQEKATLLRDANFKGLSPVQQASIADNVITTTGGLTRNLNVALFQRNQSEAAATIDNFIEQASRSAARIGPAAASEKVADFVKFAGLQAGLSPEKQAKIIQSAAENLHYNAFQAAGVDALTKGDAPRLVEIRAQLQSKDGDALDPTKRTVLTHQMFGYEQSILAKQAAEANKAANDQRLRDNQAAETYNQAFDLAVQGKRFDPSFIKKMTEDAAGTVHQDSMVELLGKQSVVSGFATKTGPERTALLERLEHQAGASGTNPAANKTLDGLKTLNSKINTSIKENPWAAAQSSGVISDAQAFDASKPDSAFAIIQKRNADIVRVENWAGAKVNPFQPQEITQLAKVLKTLPPEQAAPYLGKLGESIGNIDRINLVADDLDKSNRPLSLALKLGTDKTTAGRAGAEFVLRGAQALADKTVKRDDAVLTGWRAEIASKVRGSLGDQQMENDIIDAAYYTRAAFDQDGIESPGYGLDKSNDDAIKMVIGLPMERSGVKTILPRGMNEGSFNEKLRVFTAENLRTVSSTFFVRGQSVKPEQLANRLQEFGMRRDGSGRYIPVSGGAFVTTDAAGTQPLRLNVR